MRYRDQSQPDQGDASEDGHPCEAALELRRILLVSGQAAEIPADVLDLCISAAWIGKAVSRTARLREFLDMGIDPNTWQVIAAIGTDTSFARLALDASMHAPAAPGRGPELAAIRETEAFNAAFEAIANALASESGTSAAARRFVRLRSLSAGLVEIRQPPARGPEGVIDLRAERLRRRSAAQS